MSALSAAAIGSVEDSWVGSTRKGSEAHVCVGVLEAITEQGVSLLFVNVVSLECSVGSEAVMAATECAACADGQIEEMLDVRVPVTGTRP